MEIPDNTPARPTVEPGVTADLAAVRAALAEVEALEDQVRHRMAHLGSLLPREQFRLVWELLDAEQRHDQAERLLATRWLADELARELPEQAATITAAVGRLLREGAEVGEVA